MKFAIRCWFVILLTVTPMLPSIVADDACSIRILVGEHKDLSVTIPCVDRGDVVRLVSTFFGRQDQAAEKRFQQVFKDAGEITFSITTKR